MKRLKKILLMLFAVISVTYASDSTWTVVSKMPIPVSGATAVTFEDKIYILGGLSDSLFSSLNIIQIFDPNTLEWSVETKMLNPRAFLFAASNKDGIFYGGGKMDSIQVYSNNCASLEFYSPSNGPSVFDNKDVFNRIYSSAEMMDNSLFLIGGYTLSGSSSIIKYDVASKTVVDSFQTFNSNVTIEYGMMTALLNKKLYLIGGAETFISSTIYAIDSDLKNSFYNFPPLLKPRTNGVAVAVDETDQIYVLGGINELQTSLSSSEILTIFDNDVVVSEGPKLKIGRSDLMATTYKNKIYVFGGINKDFFTVGEVEMLDLNFGASAVGDANIIEDFSLEQNYPNPFNPSTVISYTIPARAMVELRVYDILGGEVATLVNKEQSVGTYSIDFNSSNFSLSSGVYYYYLSWNGHVLSNKMVLVK